MDNSEWNRKAIHNDLDMIEKMRQWQDKVVDLDSIPTPLCVWDRHFIDNTNGFGDGWIPSCDTEAYWFDHAKLRMTFCPHCGKKIAVGKDKRYI